MQKHKSPRKNPAAIGRVRIEAIAFNLIKWLLQLRLFRRCPIWCATWTGLTFALLVFGAAFAAWFNYGESYLAFTQRPPGRFFGGGRMDRSERGWRSSRRIQ